jgi:hypothetical protein
MSYNSNLGAEEREASSMKYVVPPTQSSNGFTKPTNPPSKNKTKK